MTKSLEILDLPDRRRWRQWLERHHDSSPGIWLTFYKKHTGRKTIPYEDSVCEALCFGWIDSLVKRVDDDRYLLKFTPRRPESIWSDRNRDRYARLKASGQLAPAGVKNAPTAKRYSTPPSRLTSVPRYITEALKKHTTALKVFENLPRLHQLRYATWIDTAKQENTRARRLDQAIRMLTAGQRLGLK